MVSLAELYKAAGANAFEAFHDVLQSIWEEEKMPDDFRDALIVSLFKNKGSRAEFENYRRLSLLSIEGKIFARIILNSLVTVAEQNSSRGTMWLQARPKHSGYDFCHETTTREVL